MKILLLSLSANPRSLSRLVAEELKELLEAAKVEAPLVDIRELPPVWVDGREEYPKEYAALEKAITESVGVVVFMPIYNYTVSSPAKAVSEIIGGALARKPVAFVTAAGSVRSHLAVRDIMASMIFEQETICFPKTLQVTKEDFENGKLKAHAQKRLQGLAAEFPDFAEAIGGFVKKHPGNKLPRSKAPWFLAPTPSPP